MLRPDRRLAGVLTVAFAAGIGTSATIAQDDRLRGLEATIAEREGDVRALATDAAQLEVEIAGLQAELVAAAKEVRRREEEMVDLGAQLAALEAAEADKLGALARQRGDLGAVLGALLRLSLQPREALILRQDAPVRTVLSARLLHYAVAPLEARIGVLRTDLSEVARLQAEAKAKRAALAQAAASLRTAREGIKAMIEAKAGLHQVTEAELAAAAERVRELAQRADDLRTLLAILPAPGEPAPPSDAAVTPATMLRLAPPPDLRDFPPRRTGVTPPVPGTLVSGFGEPGADGAESLGLVLETLTEAQVVAPHDGQVVFRGPFRGYGEILIIEHRGGYHTLLAGLGRIDAVVGQWLLAGEPVGVMPLGPAGKPRLYVELRRNGRPINPWPWLEAHISKVE